MRVFLSCMKWIFLGALLYFYGCQSTSALVKKSDIDANLLSSRVTKGELDNGMVYYTLPNTSPEGRCFLRFNVNVGSFNETDQELGMAHMVEHLAFDDRSISHDQHLAEWLQKQGLAFGPDANATTTSENTVYRLDLPSCDENTLKDALLVFRNFATNLVFRDEAIAKEKKIIDAEEALHDDKQGQMSKKLLENLYYNSAYVKRPVVGTKEVRDSFTNEMLTSFYRTWYYPQNMAIFLVGDFKSDKVEALIKDIFSDMKSAEKKSPPPRVSPGEYKKPIFIISDNTSPHVDLSFIIQAKEIARPVWTPQVIKERIALNMAIFMVRNRLNDNAKNKSLWIREPALDGYFSNQDNYELSLNFAVLPRDMEDAFMESYKYLLLGSQVGFSPTEVEEARAIMIDYVNQEVVRDKTKSSLMWVNNLVSFYQGKSHAFDASYYQQLASPIMATITAMDCKRSLKRALASGHHYFFATGSLDDNKENLSQLAALLKKAKHQKVAVLADEEIKPFAYHLADTPLENNFNLRSLPYIEAEEITFSNKVKVVLKPTTFKTDEILVAISLGDGYLVMDQKDYAAAIMAQIVLPDGGLKQHPPEVLGHYLRDKHLGVRLEILERRIQVLASTRGKDERFLFELIRAFLFEPGYSDKAIERAQEKIRNFYKQRAHSMAAPLQHDFLKALSGNDHRVGFPEMTELTHITRDDLLGWHQKYLLNEPLKIVVVGDFNKDEIKQDLYSVFGTLPPVAKSPLKTPQQLSYSPDVHQVYTVTSPDEISRIQIRYPLLFSNRFPNLEFSLVRDVLSEQLRRKIREKKNLMYDARVVFMEGKDPAAQAYMDITLAVKKGQAEITAQSIVLAINKLAQSGIKNDALIKAQKPFLAAISQAMKNNGYWADMIMNSIDNQEPMKWISNLENDVKKISVKDINAELKKYFQQKNSSTAIVNPKTDT